MLVAFLQCRFSGSTDKVRTRTECCLHTLGGVRIVPAVCFSDSGSLRPGLKIRTSVHASLKKAAGVAVCALV